MTLALPMVSSPDTAVQVSSIEECSLGITVWLPISTRHHLYQTCTTMRHVSLVDVMLSMHLLTAYGSPTWGPSRSSSSYCPSGYRSFNVASIVLLHALQWYVSCIQRINWSLHATLDSPPPCSATTETINVNAPVGHNIKVLMVSQEKTRQYMQKPSRQDCENGWRPGHFKCVYPGCTSNAVEEHRVQNHLSLHINGKKAFACDCGTRFGRLSEANRHLEDQNPCQICGDPRRKQRGTGTCNRCFTSKR